MDIMEYREYCLSLSAAEECMPFDEDTLVFKVMGKMFSYAGMAGFCRFSVKCDPALAVELRERHPEIVPGFHSNKLHWNTIHTDGNLTDAFLKEQICNSYDLVVSGLPRRQRPQRVNEEPLKDLTLTAQPNADISRNGDSGGNGRSGLMKNRSKT